MHCEECDDEVTACEECKEEFSCGDELICYGEHFCCDECAISYWRYNCYDGVETIVGGEEDDEDE